MKQENISLKKLNYQKQLMCKKHKNHSTTLNYIKHLFILFSAVTRCLSISSFASIVGILIGITSF